jgi:hypothetical protein
LATTEKISNKFVSVLIIYGNVPFFYYICHWYLIKVINVIVFFASGYTTSQIATSHQQPPTFQPDDFGFSLWGVYAIWLIVIAILYLPCKWYSNYKRTHHQWWLSYL